MLEGFFFFNYDYPAVYLNFLFMIKHIQTVHFYNFILAGFVV